MSPPRFPAWLLSRVLPAAERDDVIGDLAEDFSDRVATVGRIAAGRWYWRHAIHLTWTLGVLRPDAHGSTRSRLMSLDDLRYAVRRIVKQPAASIGSILTLACAIGAGVAAWSLLSGVLLHPLPIHDPEHLMVVGSRYAPASKTATKPGPLSNFHRYTVYPAVRERGVFRDMAAGGSTSVLVTIGGLATSRRAFFASHNFFDVIGVRLQLGRGFTAIDDVRGAPPVAILSDRIWRAAFGARSDVIGQTVDMGGAAATIVGVAPKGFRGLDLSDAPEFYLPLHVIADVTPRSTNWFAEANTGTSPTAWVQIYGRLGAGVSAEAVVAGLASLPKGPGLSDRVFGLTDVNTAALAEDVRPKMKAFGRLLGATVALLLLIGCLTVGMLLLLRTEARRDEFAMCLAMGATRWRLAIGVVIEGALLSFIGAAAAIPLSFWLLAGLRTLQLPGDIPLDLLEVPLNGRTLAVSLTAAVLATVIVAVVAGIFGLSANVADALRARSGATPRVGRRRTRAVLVVAEIAVASVLLSGAGLFLRSLTAALNLNPSYDTSRLVSGRVWLFGLGYTAERANVVFDELRERLAANGAIRSVSFLNASGGMSSGGVLVIDGEPRQMPSFVEFTGIDDAYFPTVGRPLKSGRNFTRADSATSQPVAIVSESFGRFVAKGGNPIGRHVQSYTSQRGQPPAQIEIVGVVPDLITSVRALEPLALYRPLSQVTDFPSRTVVMRATRDSSSAIRETLSTVHAVIPALSPPAFSTMDELIAQQMGPQRFGATVLGALGGIAVLLTLFGTYVLAESMTALRRREMGVRAALGATRPQLSRLILGETVRLVGAGILAGAVLAWFGAGLIRSFLFRVEPFDLGTISTVVGSVLLLALAVSLRPALRAGRVDLARVLREE